MPSTSYIEVVTKASNLSEVARQALERTPIIASVMLSTLNKCIALDTAGQSPPGHWWIVIYSGPKVALVLSCTDGYMGKYPIFIVDTNVMDEKDFIPSIQLLAHTLQRHVPIERVYSVYGPIEIAQLFSKIWTQSTGVQPEPEPYYDAKISWLRYQDLQQSVTDSESSKFEVGLAGPTDIGQIAKLCYMFASDSVSP